MSCNTLPELPKIKIKIETFVRILLFHVKHASRIKNKLIKYRFTIRATGSTIYKPWVLVSELGQREGEGVGLLGLGVCRGLMEEFKLFSTAFGTAELGRECDAVAPRKAKG